MVRGCQRQVYVVKETHSELFSEAYFILRQETTHKGKPLDLAKEAQRLIEEMDKRSCKKTKLPTPTGTGQKIGAFVVGAASSSALIGGIALLLAFA